MNTALIRLWLTSVTEHQTLNGARSIITRSVSPPLLGSSFLEDHVCEFFWTHPDNWMDPLHSGGHWGKANSRHSSPRIIPKSLCSLARWSPLEVAAPAPDCFVMTRSAVPELPVLLACSIMDMETIYAPEFVWFHVFVLLWWPSASACPPDHQWSPDLPALPCPYALVCGLSLQFYLVLVPVVISQFFPPAWLCSFSYGVNTPWFKMLCMLLVTALQ